MSTGYADLLSRFTPTAPTVLATKQAEVDAAAQRKQAALGGSGPDAMPSDESMYRIAAATRAGTGSSITNPVENDVRSGSLWDRYVKYGAGAGQIASNTARADAALIADRNAKSSSQERIQDFGDSVVGGIGASVLGVGALGAGLINNRAGGYLSEKAQELSQFVQTNQSAGLNARRKAYAVTNDVSSADNAAQFEEDKKTDGDFLASLKRIGRDVGSAVGNASADGAILGDGIANGVGSLLVGGPLAKGLSVIGKAVVKGATLARPSLLASEAAGRAYSIAGKAAMPASIGIMEGGGAYQQTYMEAMDKLKDRTDITEERKVELAGEAALEAAAIQTPLSAATGVLTSKFEAAPFRVPSLKTAAGNLLKEAVEEGAQSATAQLATNQAISDKVDGTQALSEGVGEQIGLGALYGMGTAGAIQTPGAILRGTVDAAKLTGRTVMKGVNKVIGEVGTRADVVTETLKAQSPVSPDRMDATYATAVQVAPAIKADTVQKIQEATDVTPEQKTATLDYVEKFFNEAQFTDQDADALPAPMGDIVRGSTDKFDAIKRAAAYAVDETADPQTRLMAALYLEGNVAKYAQPLEDTITAIPDEHPALDDLRKFEDVFLSLGQDPRVREVIQIAKQLSEQLTPDTVSDANIATPAGQTAAQNVVELASLDPARVNPATVDAVLKHAASGKVNFDTTQLGYLKVAASLVQADQDHVQRAKDKGLTKSGVVTEQIRTESTPEGFDEKSASGHMDGVLASMRAGNTEQAKARLNRFMLFAQHMQNKVVALNESFMSGDATQDNTTKYQSLNPKKAVFAPSKEGLWLNGLYAQSVRNAQTIASDALAVASIANSLALGFPQLGIAPLPVAALVDDAWNDTPENIQKKFRDNKQARDVFRQKRRERVTNAPSSVAETASTPAPVEAPAAVGAPVQALTPAVVEERNIPQAEQTQSDTVRRDNNSETRPQSQAQKTNPVPETQVTEPVLQAKPVASKVEASAVAVEEPTQPVVPTQEDVSAEVVVESPTPEIVDPEIEETPLVSGIDAAYPNLLGSPEGRGRNLFKQAFTLPAEAISRLTGRENPLIDLREALSSGSKFRAMAGENAGDQKLNDATSKVYLKLIAKATDVGRAMNRQVREGITKNAAFIEKTPDWNSYKEYRAANILETVDGKTRYNAELQQNAIIGGLQWFLQADQRQRPMDSEDVAAILGYDPTDDQVKLFNQGLYYNGAVVDLTDAIMRYWGVKANPNVGVGITRGVPEGVAKELLRAMESAGLIKTNSFKIDNKEYRQISFNIDELFDENERADLMANPTMIEKLSMVEPQEDMFVGKPPEPTPKTQLRQPDVQLTAQQTDMVKKEQSTPFYIVPHMLNFLKSLEAKGAVALFGHGDIDDKIMNKVHKTALTSVNRSVHAAYDAISAMAARAGQVGSDTGLALEDTPIYYAYEFTSVNRLQMLGKHNPQSNKLTREIIMPTRSTMDMTTDVDQGRFWLAIAQAWGEKVHKQDGSVSMTKAKALAANQYAPAIELLQDWLKKSPVNQTLALDDAQVQKLRSTLSPKGGPVAAVAFYAAMEIARLQNATPAELSAFNTSLYVEADGITDGPMNAMVHTAAGDFTSTWIETLRKGGLYLDKAGATSNEQGNAPDLYQVTANKFKDALADLQFNVRENVPVRDSLNSLIRLSGSLLGDLTYDPETGQLTDVSRGAVKNPLTVVIYGAGDRGIANKISSTLVKAMYERMTAQLQFEGTQEEFAQSLYPDLDPTAAQARFAEYEQDVRRLMMTRVENADGGLRFVDLSGQTKTPDVKKSNADFEFTKEQMKNMQDNILTMFVEPLQQGIQANIGETIPGTTMIRQATQVQGIYLQYAYQRAIQEALDAREALAKTDESGWKRSDFLSQNEIKAVKAKLKYLSPFIETGTQNMMISGSARTPMLSEEGAKSTIEFSRSLDGKGFTGGYMSGPTNPGVSGIPKTVIGTGDGQMMQNFSVNPDIADGYMLIFDGANFRLSDVEGYSEKINQAVYDGWMQNPMGAVSNTFNDFMRLADLTKIEPAMLEDLTYALTGERGSMDPAEAVAEIKKLQNDLTKYADDVAARKRVLGRVKMSVDHMASAASPFNPSGSLVSLEGMSTQQAAVRLNELLAEERAQMAQEKGKTAAPTSDTLTVVRGAQLRDLVRATNLKGEMKSLFAKAVSATEKLGYQIISGSQDQINQYGRENGLRVIDNNTDEVTNGYIVTADRSIYLVNPSEETLLHEMIHAATINQLHSYYLNDGTLSNEQSQAIERIEGLMREWLGNTDAFNNLNAETRDAARNARNGIRAQLSGDGSVATNKANAVNEFMAWVLANQNLSQVASQTKVKNPLLRIAKDVLAAIKSLLGLNGRVGDDLLSNLRFNTQIVMTGPRPVGQVLADSVLFQSGNFGTNDRLTELGQQFTDKIARKIHNTTNPAARLTETLKAGQASIVADQVTNSVIANGFPMDMQSKSTFQMMLAAFSADIALDANAVARAQELFTHVSQTLKVEDLMRDPENETPDDRYQAQAKYDTIVGTRGVQNDEQGRSTLVPTFLALATVDESLRDVLSRMALPKGERADNTTIDNRATNMAVDAMERLGVAMAGERQNSTSVTETVDALTDKIASIAQDRTAFIDQAAAPVGNAIDAANSWMVEAMQKMARDTVVGADKVLAKTNSKPVEFAANFAKLLAGVFDADTAGDLGRVSMSAMNRSNIWQPAQDLLNELVGRTSENANVYDMIKEVRSVIQSLRQQYREHLPELLQKQFTREVSADEWSSMFKGMAKTDIASLRSTYSVDQTIELLVNPAKRASDTKRIERDIKATNNNSSAIIQKAQQLARYMNTGVAPHNLLRNAYAIANLFGEGVRLNEAVDPDLVKNIDHLVSLYAIEGLNQSDQAALSSLVQDEKKGMSFLVSYLEGQRSEELAGAANDPKIQANLYKGYIPSEQQGGVALMVADDADFVELRKRGYERVSDYEGADAEYGKAKRGYYFSPVSGRSVYSQGIIQTVHKTVGGINAATGFTTSNMVAGRITEPAIVDRITKLSSRMRGGKEQLMPIFDGAGKVVAYERSVDPMEQIRLSKNTDMSKMLGAWRGRQAEEALAGKYNNTLIDHLYDMWNTPDQLARRGEFVNILDKKELAKDRVLADAVKLIPYDTLGYISEKFGEEGTFMVRRDMLNDTLGYRQASVTDAWTGTTRWSPEVQKGIEQIATAVFGVDAYKRMVQAEKFIQNRVTDARVMIVVKSIVVPMTNLIANMYQLSARGVPIMNSVKAMPKKTAEINSYVKGRLRKIELEGLLRAAGSDAVAQRKLSAEIQSIEDTAKRLTIWPLIEAGEFTSVSDIGLGKEEIDITEGRLTAYVEGLVDKMPDGIKTAAKYAIVSKDTALFKGLQKTVEYGDFLAKAVLYDDLTQRKGLSPKEAMGQVTEEFVNYDRLPGRARNYLDSMGLLWFWNFKVRSAKIAVSMIRNNPLHSMLSMVAPAPPFIGSVGNPITDNILSVAADGRLGNSMGPSQGFRSMQLIPWLNLAH